MKTNEKSYADYLMSQENVLWKRLLRVQLPYSINLRLMRLGRTLDIGCGIGRNLRHLQNSAGVDHNASCVAICRQQGLSAFLPDELHKEIQLIGTFDSLLLSHVVEHMTLNEGVETIKQYIPYLKPYAKIVVITPQKAGQKSDKTHVTYYTNELIKELMQRIDARNVKIRSFPLHQIFGNFFKYNEKISSAIILP